MLKDERKFISMKYFKSIEEFIKKISEECLVVIDIDNTISKPDKKYNYFGSDFWYEYQIELINKNSGFFKNIEELNEKITDIISNLDMVYCEDNVDKVILNIHKEKEVILLTSRDTPTYTSTIRHIYPINKYLLIEEHIKKLECERIENKQRPSLKNGIIFANGHNKGNLLKSYINQSNKKFKKIVFIDDKISNLINVKNKLGDKVICIHYTYEDKNKEIFEEKKENSEFKNILNNEYLKFINKI
tara:strand:+ start:1104 stop:1838 length:735 start_codon:yes stop_codon:yes gene_type:complete